MLCAATAAVCSTMTVFMLAMWPTLKVRGTPSQVLLHRICALTRCTPCIQATERASLATEAAMKAMEEASEATTKASREMEVLMLRTQAELPETLAAVEEASLQWDRLGLEIRDSGRRFGLTNPGATAGTLAAPRSGNRAPGPSGPVSSDPLLAYLQDGSVGSGGGAADLGDQLAVAAGMLPGAETVSAAVGRFVEEATQAGAAALAGGAVAAAGGVAGADPDVLNASLEALRSWRTRLNKVLEATRDVVAGAAEEVSNQTRDAALSSRAALNPGRAALKAVDRAASTTSGKPAADGATAPDGALVQVPPEQQQDGESQNGLLTWLGGGLRRVPGAVLTGAAVTGGFVAGALSAVKLPGLRRASDPPPATADEDEARAERAKAVALALALAEEAAEEARAATNALGRLFNTTAAAITSSNPKGEAIAGALPGGDGAEFAGGDMAPSLALADEAAALAAAKAAEAAMQEASRASTALLGALAESRAAGDPIEADVLAALETLPDKVFAIPVDDDSYDYSIIADGDGEGTDTETASEA